MVDAAASIPLKLLFACSCCSLLWAYIYPLPPYDRKWKAVVSWVIKKSWTTVKLRWGGSSNAPIMLNSVTGSLRLRACRMRCFITMALSVGRSWRAATISALNSKTRLIGYSGILSTAEHLSCYLESLQELNHIRNRFPFFVATHFIKQSKACKLPLNKLLINQQTIHYGQQTFKGKRYHLTFLFFLHFNLYTAISKLISN